ncbi:MAG: hypothetical protein HPY89_10310 [Pelotomaculum sp.]|nr:hypothetical protein [Pelotomaculum sp.]
MKKFLIIRRTKSWFGFTKNTFLKTKSHPHLAVAPVYSFENGAGGASAGKGVPQIGSKEKAPLASHQGTPVINA